MATDIGSTGCKIALSTEVASVTEKYVGDDVRNFLGDHGLITWVYLPCIYDLAANTLTR